MPDFSLAPVDYQPDFDVSLVPVDHDPFGAGGVAPQTQGQTQQSVSGADQPNINALAANSQAVAQPAQPPIAKPATSRAIGPANANCSCWVCGRRRFAIRQVL